MTEPGDEARPPTTDPVPVAGLPRPVDDPRQAEATLLARWHRRFPGAPRVGAELLERYRETGRRYHDVRHLADVERFWFRQVMAGAETAEHAKVPG